MIPIIVMRIVMGIVKVMHDVGETFKKVKVDDGFM